MTEALVAGAATLILASSAIQDLRSRTAANWHWPLLWLVALFATSQAPDPAWRAPSLVLGVVLGLAAWRWWGFGAADAKAAMAASALFDPLPFLSVVAVSVLGAFAWAWMTDDRRIPFLVPFGAAAASWLWLAAYPGAVAWVREVDVYAWTRPEASNTLWALTWTFLCVVQGVLGWLIMEALGVGKGDEAPTPSPDAEGPT